MTAPTTPQAQVSEEKSEPARENLGNKIGWVCFHCWEFFPPTFVGQRDAQAHFGGAELREPACLINKKDHGLLLHVRALELERDKLQQQLSALSTPPARDDVAALVEAATAGLKAAQLLQQNAEGCAVNHHGDDFQIHGVPGWLRDTQASIDRLAQSLARVRDGGK